MKKSYLFILVGMLIRISTYAQTSKNETTGFWTDPSIWVGGVVPGTLVGSNLSAVSKTIIINGTVKAVNNIALSGILFNGSSITVNNGDTLVMLGDMAMGNFSTLNNNGVLVVLGNFTNNGGDNNINGSGKMVVTGNYSTDNFLGLNNTFIGPSYVFGSVTGLPFNSGDIDNHATLASADPALNTWVNTMSGTLPVQLVYFKATTESDNVILSWETASELNNDHFVIERSGNGFDFREIATVAGAGYSNIKINYEYVDNASLAGVSYYRLTQVDYDGVAEVFKVVSVKQNETDITVFPNPTSDYLFFRHIKDGQTVIVDDLRGNNGSRQFNIEEVEAGKLGIDVRELESGLYNLRVIDESEGVNTSIRFVKE